MLSDDWVKEVIEQEEGLRAVTKKVIRTLVDEAMEEAIRAAVAEAVAAEKKANAKLVEDEEGWNWAYHTGDDPPFPMGRISYATRHNIAAAILARGEGEQ